MLTRCTAAQVRGGVQPGTQPGQQPGLAAAVTLGSILAAALRALASAGTALLLPALLGAARVALLGQPMVWFASQWVAYCFYIPLALLGALLPWLAKSSGRARAAADAHLALANSVLGCSLLLAVAGVALSRAGAGSSFVFAWPAASGALTGLLLAAWGLHWGSLLAALVLGAVPLLAGTEVRGGVAAAACCLLPAACCLLPAACCLLPAACCCTGRRSSPAGPGAARPPAAAAAPEWPAPGHRPAGDDGAAAHPHGAHVFERLHPHDCWGHGAGWACVLLGPLRVAPRSPAHARLSVDHQRCLPRFIVQ